MIKIDPNDNAINIDNNQSMFVLTILEKIKETRLKISQGSVTVLWKRASYQETTVKLTNKQLNKLKSPPTNKTWTIKNE